MESVLFDVAEVSLPFNAILGRLARTNLWQLPIMGTYS
jgi:hypothetical protein